MNNKGNLYILITAFLWSTSALFIKSISGSSVVINGLRSLVAFMFFVVYRKSIKMHITKITFLAAACLTLTNLLFVSATQLTNAANAITLQYLAPIFVLLWDCLYNKRYPKVREIVCCLSAFLGMILFFIDGLNTGYMLGNVVAVAAGLCFSGVFFVNSLEGSSPNDSSMIAFMMSFVISIPFIKNGMSFDFKSVSGVLFLGIFQVGLAYAIYNEGIKLTTPLNASLISLVEVILNPLWVYIVYKEKLSQFALVGAFVIMGSVIINIVLSNKEK